MMHIHIFIISACLATLIWICWRWSIARVIRRCLKSQINNQSIDIQPDIEITNSVMGRILLIVQPGERLSVRCIAIRLRESGFPFLKTANVAVILKQLCRLGVISRKFFGRHLFYSLKTGA